MIEKMAEGVAGRMAATRTMFPLAIVLALGLAGCGAERGDSRGDDLAAEAHDVAQPNTADSGETPMASAEEAVAQTSADLDDAPYEGEADTIDALLQAIRQQVGNPVANSRDECRLAGIGHRPCGGPERYLLYSVQTTDEALLLPMIERYNALVRQRVEDEGLVGTCEMLPKPGIIVRNGVCSATEQATR